MNKNQEIDFISRTLAELINLAKSNILFPFVLLYILSLGLSLEINNFFFISLVFATIIKTNYFKFSYQFLPMQLFFIWIALSYFWSIDQPKTLQSLPREIHFFALPLIFYFQGDFFKKVSDIILKYFSFSIFILSFYFIARAVFRFFSINDNRVFFFHGEYGNDFGLVPKELNAIHFSVFVALAYFYFLQKEKKSRFEIFILFFLLITILLLSSSIVILSLVFLTLSYYFFFSKLANKMRLRNIVLFTIAIACLSFYNKIATLLENEIKTNTEQTIGHNVINSIPNLQNKITIYEAWTKEQFTPNDFFPGTAFRVYQLRVFFEIISEQEVFFSGLGFNASQTKIQDKGIEYNIFLGNELYEGYQMKNFHNQYIQVFAELGIVGFLLLILILLINIRNAFLSKDFLHIAFAILMISLFLTESFLWRQRGVAFFVMFYCLFNYKTTQNYIKSKK